MGITQSGLTVVELDRFLDADIRKAARFSSPLNSFR